MHNNLVCVLAYILDHRMHNEYDQKFNFLDTANHFEAEYARFHLMVFYAQQYYLPVHRKNQSYHNDQVLSFEPYTHKVLM